MKTRLLLIFSLFLSSFISLYAQSPGGVATNLQSWLKADAGTGTTTNGAAVSVWDDQSGNSRHHNQLAPISNPKFVGAGGTFMMNYNPALRFDGVDDRLIVPSYINAATQSVHIFVVSRINVGSSAAWQTTYGIYNDIVNAVWYNHTPGNYLAGNQLSDAKANVYYGLTSHIMPKTTVAPKTIWNGTVKTGTNYNYLATSPNFTVGSDVVGADFVNGDIQEVIVYSGAVNTDFNAADLNKIQSYLAVKYGISLDPAGQANYTSSAGTQFWTGTSNTGYQNNIFGIGRDVNSALNQKQAFSYADSSISLYLGTLASLNSNNGSTISGDNSFLMLGDNNLNGINSTISYPSGQTFANSATTEAINAVSNRIWKAQATTQTTWTANINANKFSKAKYVFVSSSNTFPTASTRIYPVVAGSANNVEINDGDYISFGMYITAPGGVINNLSLWLKADAGVTGTTAVSRWSDQSGNGKHLAQDNVTFQPALATAASTSNNYNPALTFSAHSLYRTQNVVSAVNGSGTSIFSVARPTSTTGTYKTLWDCYANTPTLNTLGSGWDFYQMGSTHTLPVVSGKPTIATAHWQLGTTNSRVNEIDGYAQNIAGSPITPGTIDYILGLGYPAINAEAWIGDIAENIIFGTKLTGDNLIKVNTYLAIKYGVTLKNTTAYQYKATDGTVIWDGTALAAYHNNVAGIGRDDVEELHQKQSKSVNTHTAGQVTVGLETIAVSNPVNANTITNDKSYLVWGDNGNIGTTVSVSVATGYHLARIWKVENTGVAQRVKITYPISSVLKHASQTVPTCIQPRFIANSSDNFTVNNFYNMSVEGTDYVAYYTFPAGVSYFTFGQIGGVPGNILLPETNKTTVVHSDCVENSWSYFYEDASLANKLLAISGLTDPQLNNLQLNITYNGIPYTKTTGAVTTNIMQRLITITDLSAGTYSNVKIRLYYSTAELDATEFVGALKQTWFKVDGDAAATIADLDDNSLLVGTELTPVYGVENGINYVEFSGLTSFSTFGYTVSGSAAVMPVSLTDVKAKMLSGSKVRLDWKTVSEQNNAGFVIERQTEGKDWENIGFMASKATGGNSNMVLHYSFEDSNPKEGVNLYRLKQQDINGGHVYSQIVSVKMEVSTKVKLYPNPLGRAQKLVIEAPAESKIMIYNVAGKLMNADVLGKGAVKEINTTGLPVGQYIVQIHTTQDIITQKLIIK